MPMTFAEDDEDAYYRRRDEPGELFAPRLNTHGVPGDPDDAAKASRKALMRHKSRSAGALR